MKKLIVVFSVLAIAGKVSAQGAGKASFQDLHFTTKATQASTPSVHDITITKANQSITKIGPGQLVFPVVNPKQGANSLTKVGAGRLEFTRSGNTISNVIFKDDAGNTIKLMPEPGATSTIPVGSWEIRANTKAGLFRLFGDSN